jgi:hypothetical protein
MRLKVLLGISWGRLRDLVGKVSGYFHGVVR